MIRGVLDELKKRSVVRVAGLYAVAGWAVFQVVNGLFPALHLPPWTVSLAALLFLAGFPIAVALAWMFEFTPEGVRLAPRSRRRFGAGQFGWIDWLVGAVVIIVFGFAAVQLYHLRGSARDERGPALAAASLKSVAVLPFVSFSAGQGDSFFADGLTEELINSLAQSAELKVAGRTSSFYFKGRNLDLREVGRKLGVAHVVEGSVRRAGARLRVTAQLISVKDGFHLWSQTYDRTDEDALAIQTEVAEKVAENLKARLVGPERPAAAPSPEDYRLALIARGQLRTQALEELRAARAAFAALRRRNPGNAEMHAGYAQATILIAQNFLALPFNEARREAEAAIAQALGTDPRSADAWRAKGAFERVVSIRSGEGSHHVLALAAFRKALELDPRDPETMTLLAKQLLTEGQPEQAAGLVGSALATDPLSRTSQQVMAAALAELGRFDEARRAFRTLLSLYPDDTSALSDLASMLIFKQGRLEEAALLLDDPKVSAEDPLNAFLLAACMANMAVPGGVEDALGRIGRDSPAGPVARAAALQLAGRRDELLSYALAERQRSGDPVWDGIEVVERALMGEVHGARAALPASFPGLLKEPADLAGYRDIDAIVAGFVLQGTGSAGQGRRILEAVLQRQSGARFQAADQLAYRGMAFAALGRAGEAVAAFDAAARAGWRMPIEYEYFIRVRDYPFMAGLVRDPRFASILGRIEADNARMRDIFVKARRQAPGARP